MKGHEAREVEQFVDLLREVLGLKALYKVRVAQVFWWDTWEFKDGCRHLYKFDSKHQVRVRK